MSKEGAPLPAGHPFKGNAVLRANIWDVTSIISHLTNKVETTIDAPRPPAQLYAHPGQNRIPFAKTRQAAPHHSILYTAKSAPAPRRPPLPRPQYLPDALSGEAELPHELGHGHACQVQPDNLFVSALPLLAAVLNIPL